MALYRVEIHPKNPQDDPAGLAALHELRQAGQTAVRAVRTARIFLLQGDDRLLTVPRLNRIKNEVLADPVTETAEPQNAAGDARRVEVHVKPGVMDPVAASCEMAIADLLDVKYSAAAPPVEVRTGRLYFLEGELTDADADRMVRKFLANDSIEQVHLKPFEPKEFPHGRPYEFKRVEVPLRTLTPEQLHALSRKGHLFLDLTEMQAVQAYFKQQQRDPTDVELETIAQSWSEHCVHKTLKARVEFTHHADPAARGEHPAASRTQTIDNLVKSTIFRATSELNLPWTISVFKDNAGVIAFDDDYAVCMKVETHNRPSAIEPYGGAATGIGGCIRDVMGTGLGAKPIAATDVFCFAAPDTPAADVPAGVIHPRRSAQRVTAGVRDYGNRMGIPTVNGAVYFDQRYIGNPLVFCGTIGLMPRRFAQKGAAAPGDRILVMGGRTGRDGIHGATFSSDVVTNTHADEFSHAVQIGNAITEKKMLDVLLQARDAAGGPLFHAITDCGAGGLSSAVGEMGEKTGASVQLEKVPLKYQGLSYAEIWISEAQERMVLAVPPDKAAKMIELAAAEDVEVTDIGCFDGSGMLSLTYEGHNVALIAMEFIHDGLPRPVRKALWQQPHLHDPSGHEPRDYAHALGDILAHPTIASKHWIIRQYDHEVQGNTIIKPLVGPGGNGPGDAAVVRPLAAENGAVALAVGCQPRFGDVCPYHMALNGMDEAIRNIVCVGGDPARTALLDNFCWPKCTDPMHLGALVLACQACYDGAMAYRTPFISGKDSLSNEFITESGRRICIPYTLLISAISVMADARRCITMEAKQPGNKLVAVGTTRRELGGSIYWALAGHVGKSIPVVDLKTAPALHQAVAGVIAAGLVCSAHDASEGGLAVALAEMLFAGDLGAAIELDKCPRSEDVVQDDVLLFSESAGRYVLEVEPQNCAAVLAKLQPFGAAVIGEVNARRRMQVAGISGKVLMDESVDSLRQRWLAPLDW
ncbi:MAG: phosphoribosylformylglycinamidine synthase subunit PurL [Phycisphaerae bacterium]